MSRPARRSTRGLWVGAVFLAAFEILNSAVDSDSLRPSAFLLWDWAKDASYAAVPIAFAVGLVGVRASRGRVGRLIDDLAIEADLQSSLARALADPSIEVLYRVDGSERLLDALGRPRSLPPDGSNRRLTPLTHRGDELGVLVHDPALDEQQELIRSVCAAAGLALANERLAAEVRAQLADVRASRTRIVQAGDAERRRIERNLHDGAQQRLVAMRLNLRLAAAATDDPDLARELEANVAELDDAIAELRSLARGIHPAVLTEGGIAEAVEVLVERTPLPITVDDRLDGRHPPEIEAAAYYVIAESLSNVSKYADATTIRVTMEARDGTLVVEVVDDGVGGADAVAGTGLRGLDDRVAATGGRLIVTSPPGEGTLVRAELPLAVNSESGSS